MGITAGRGGGSGRSERPPTQSRPGGGLRRTVASAMVWSSIGRFGTLGFGLVVQATVARLLVPDDFGAYALAISYTATVAMVTQGALPQTAVRAVAGANADPSGSRARPVVLTVIATAAGIALVAFALVAIGGARVAEWVFPDAGLSTLAFPLAVLVGLRVAENVTPEVFRGLRQFRDASLFGGLLVAAFLALLTLAVYLVHGHVALATVVGMTIAASAVALAVAAARLRRTIAELPAAARSGRLFDAHLLSPALWAGTIVSFAITQLDLWVVGAMGDADEVALYSAAFRLSMLVMVPAAIANFVVPPLVVELLERGERRRLASIVQTVAVVAGIPALALVLVFVVFGGPVTSLVYGSFYEEAGPIVAILAVGKVANVLTGACGITLVMSGGQRHYLLIMGANLATTLPLQVAGFAWWGLAGLATATAVGLALQNLTLLAAVWRSVGISTAANPFTVRRVLREYGGFKAFIRSLGPGRGRSDPGDPVDPLDAVQ